MNKKQRQKYYIWSISHWWVWITLFFSIGGFVWTIVRSLDKFQDIPFLVGAIIFLVGLLSTLIAPTIVNTNTIKHAYKDGLLWEAINVFLDNKDYSLGDKKYNDNHNKYIQLLKEACELPYIRANLDLDGEPFDEFFNMDGSISVTDASISAWKYPEYSWFLTSQYAASLYKQGLLSTGTKFCVEDRNDGTGRVKDEFLNHMKKLCESAFGYSGFSRIYLIKKDDFNENRSMIEQFVAGHTLFGINIFFLDRDEFLKESDRQHLYQNMIASMRKKDFSEIPEHKRYLDIMCYKKINNKDDLFYVDIDSSTQNIVELELKDVQNAFDSMDKPLENWNKLIESIKEILNTTPLRNKIVLYPANSFNYKSGCNHRLNKKKSVLLFK